MQEHAWTVGRSGKKAMAAGARASANAPRDVPSAAAKAPTSRVAAPAAVLVAGGGDEAGTPGRKINGLQQRQEDVVDELDRLEEKYRGLFELAARAQG